MENFGPDLKGFVKISKFAGERFDLIQAGGGNTSVKIDDSTMLVKASGFALSDVDETTGFAKVNYSLLKEFLQNQHLSDGNPKLKEKDELPQVMEGATISSGIRPSIETLMHCLMGKFAIHAHPLPVNIVACRKNWRDELQLLFPECICVDYHTPGVDLATAIMDKIAGDSIDPNQESFVVFLQNHGIIVTAPTYEQVIDLIENTTNKIEIHLGLDYSRYRSVTRISGLVSKKCRTSGVAYLSEDLILLQAAEKHKDYFSVNPFFPDMVVYNGAPTLTMESLDDEHAVDAYFQKYDVPPKIILCDRQVYFMANSVRKAQALESVVKFQILSMLGHGGELNFLSQNESNYLAGWEAEKFRSAL